MMKLICSLCLLLSFKSFAIIGVGTNTAILIDLVTTTASQLNELEKLVSNAERYTQKMQEYNILFQDEYFRAQRVLYVAESVAAKKEVQDLGTLNLAIRRLKYSMYELELLMEEYAKIRADEEVTHQKVEIQKRVNESKSQMAEKQIDESSKARNQARANQLTAQNTALMYEAQIDSHNTQLEILERLSTTNRLLAEQLEEKRLEQIERERSLGLTEEGK
jgi:hypothetical protein